jgi:hypothetical protein
MPSHIYVRLGLWQDAINSNQRSADAASAMEQAQHWSGAWGQRLHAWDYLAYADLQLGNDSAAQRLSAGAWLSLLQGDTTRALSAAQTAAHREDHTEEHPVTPGPLLPARELYADLLLTLHRPAEALQGYRAVDARQPHRARVVRGIQRAEAEGGTH